MTATAQTNDSGHVAVNLAQPESSVPLDIKMHEIEGRRIVIHGRDVTVQCVDGCEYSRRFMNKAVAQAAKGLVAILPSLWRKK